MIYSKQEFKIAQSLTDLLFLADLLGDEELGHGHVVHGGEVHSNSLKKIYIYFLLHPLGWLYYAEFAALLVAPIIGYFLNK